MHGSYLGPEFAQAEIERRLGAAGARFERSTTPRCSRRPSTHSPKARWWAGSRAGWSSGRARSATARSWATRAAENAEAAEPEDQVSRSRSGRSRPSVLVEHVAEWFELDADEPLHAAGRRRARGTAAASDRRTTTSSVRHRQAQRAALEIPAVTHVDYSARIQTVHAETNPRFHALIGGSRSEPDAPCW